MRTLRGALRDHFDAPRNVGRLEAGPGDGGCIGHGVARNAACGDELHFWVRVEAGRVAAARFQAQACSAVIACGSLAAEAVEGLSTPDARAVDVSLLAEQAGGVPAGKAHAPSLAARALLLALDRASAGRTASRRASAAGGADGDDPCSDS